MPKVTRKLAVGKTKTVCRDCGDESKVKKIEFGRSSQPRCDRCGGLLERQTLIGSPPLKLPRSDVNLDDLTAAIRSISPRVFARIAPTEHWKKAAIRFEVLRGSDCALLCTVWPKGRYRREPGQQKMQHGGLAEIVALVRDMVLVAPVVPIGKSEQ